MLSNKEIKRKAKEMFMEDQWPTVGANVVSDLITGAASSVYGIGGLIIGGPMVRGLNKYYLKLVRKEEKEFVTIFDGFKDFVNNFTTFLLYVIYLALWSILIIPGIVKGLSYSMTFYLMEDNPGLSNNEAITMSRKMMNGHKWRLFCLQFSYIGWLLLSILTFGILAILYVGPWMNAATAVFYDELKNEQAPKTEAEVVPEE